VTSRIFTVCGSLGAVSVNRAALHVVHRSLSIDGIEVIDDELLSVIPPMNPDLVDVPDAAVVSFRRHIATADAVIIAAPEYAGSLAGSTKNALDWVVGSGELYDKPVGILSAGTTGGTFARQVLARTLVWQGAHVVAELGISRPRTKSDASGNITDPVTITQLETFSRAVVTASALPAEDRMELSNRVAAALGVSRREADG
jgi:chromate reductase, NAD(P)H dehydrogenase (quinone)